MRITFLDKLRNAAAANQSWLCVGLDPDPALAPDGLVGDPRNPDWIAGFNREIIEATRDLACCYKANLAFYEAFGVAGYEALRDTLKAIPANVPVMGDAKRGDIANTARGYATGLFDAFGFDAITVNPYLGGDSLEPFLAYRDRGVFVLCKTSNPGSGDLQDLIVQAPNGEMIPLYRVIARRTREWGQGACAGLVVGATYPSELRAVRADVPDLPILVPGVGPQQGDLEAAVQAGMDVRGEMALVNASRGISYASRGPDWADAARVAARNLRDAINRARGVRQ